MTGSTERAVSPSSASSVGTSRQPRRRWPSCSTIEWRSAWTRWRWAVSRGRNTRPLPYSPAAGSGISRRAHSRRRNRSGIWIRMPAPSPVFGSQPQAPRCRRFLSTVSACGHDRVGLAPLEVHHEAHPARVVLVTGVVEALRRRHSWCRHRLTPSGRPLAARVTGAREGRPPGRWPKTTSVLSISQGQKQEIAALARLMMLV